ncbi:MAG: RdgB/HAM1 family non-canonical purine NTP pyrophosphatase [Eubacteriales bacterium]|nr:RdgB/HAM1 family non-canonical purine NTP pyrophosphatase [Eubacteriales bacterium]
MRIIFASNNEHKLKEIKKILYKYKNNIFFMKDLNINLEIEENGKTFKENAYLKAKALYDYMTNHNIIKENDIILADDTGLCIDYLDGKPGIFSARYLGHDTSQQKKNESIIELMKGLAYDKRKAHFICVICLIKNKNIIEYYDGLFCGHISNDIKGVDGFGYDPIFIPNGETKSVALLGEEYKNKYSHRALALKKINFT